MKTFLTGAKKNWIKILIKKWGRLEQDNVYGFRITDNIDFFHQSYVPKYRKNTYAIFVCDFRTLKYDPYRVYITVGGDKIS